MESDPNAKMPFVAPIRAGNLLWLVILAGGFVAVQLYGTPHLRLKYTWNGRDAAPVYYSCDYGGLSFFQLRPSDGRCPLFILAHARKGS